MLDEYVAIGMVAFLSGAMLSYLLLALLGMACGEWEPCRHCGGTGRCTCPFCNEDETCNCCNGLGRDSDY